MKQSEQDFCVRLRELRKSMGISQEDVADKCNSTRQTVCHYEKGIRKPSMDFIQMFCRVYGVSADYLLGLSDKPMTEGIGLHTIPYIAECTGLSERIVTALIDIHNKETDERGILHE